MEAATVLPTRVEMEAGRSLSPAEIFEITALREMKLSRLLMLYIGTGLIFMLLPGTFLGVWNLLSISAHRSASSVSPAWIQAHGHAQIFGWIGTFILGIGFHSIPKLRRMGSFGLWAPWTCWVLWTSGVTLRWLTTVYQWHWRVLMPLSAAMELAAFLIFFRIVSGHRPQDAGKSKLEEWIFAVIAGAVGFFVSLLMNFGAALFLALRGSSPELPHRFDQSLLVFQTWGFLVPFVWGFSAKWLPIFLGLRPVRGRRLLWAVGLNSLGVLIAPLSIKTAVVLLVAGVATAIHALRLMEPAERPAKIKEVHSSFPLFIRLAYFWALVAAVLGIWAASVADASGIWGASRHALTVGFLSTMVFAIGQRVLPAFSGMRLLFSRKLMFLALLLLTAGCLMRVSSEVLAYQGLLQSAWSWLPVSAVTEMSAVALFALNLFATSIKKPPSPPILKMRAETLATAIH
jgi:uncharacterized protein involved in response to NO